MIVSFQNIAIDIVIFRGVLYIPEIVGITVAALDKEGGIFHVLQPVDGGAHNILFILAGVKGKLGVIVILDFIHCAEAENCPEHIGVFRRQ